MATIVLSAVGSLFGPIGQVIGSLAGNAIDNALFGPEDREGPRLKELAVTGSSYGNPIARQFGTMRVPGTIIWSTDLAEHRDKQSNGKGAPSTVAYSYSVSFAVALSSRPIDRIGRIWADGNLLRGSSGDLKSSGMLRAYNGHGDQPCDPVMEAALGEECPAFRGCAYVVFEDLDLTDFGNRIPALTFEVFAGSGSDMIPLLMNGEGLSATDGARFSELSGFSHEGGTLRDISQLVDKLHPLAPTTSGDGLVLTAAADVNLEPILLPSCASWDEGDYGKQSGYASARAADRSRAFAALRYYDPAREYQPGMQHAENSEGSTSTFQFPGAFSASQALSLAREANRRAAVARDTLAWRCAELDPAIEPGSLVVAPGVEGVWQVAAWEWRERGIELELVRHRRPAIEDTAADPGHSWTPRDRATRSTHLRVFEAPWDGSGSPSVRQIYAAVGAQSGLWSGASLFADQGGSLLPLGLAAHERAVLGGLAEPLGPSNGLRFEASATMRVQLLDEEAILESTDQVGIAQGSNRLMVGHEVIQFATATPLGDGLWELQGLLRGRGGSEIEAAAGHARGADVILLDERLVPLGENSSATAAGAFAAIGRWDREPVLASLRNERESLRPPAPVHPRSYTTTEGDIEFQWIRRARGQWAWLDEVPQPLVEENERYEVGYGPVDAPFAKWSIEIPRFNLSASVLSELRSSFGEHSLWVRQLGSFAKSRATLLGNLPTAN